MADVLRFRVNRSPRRQSIDGITPLNPFAPSFGKAGLSREELAALNDQPQFKTVLQSYTAPLAVLTLPGATIDRRRQAAETIWGIPLTLRAGAVTPMLSPLPLFDEWMRAHGDAPSAEDLVEGVTRLGRMAAGRTMAPSGANPLKQARLDPTLWVDWGRCVASLAAHLFFNTQDAESIDLRGRIIRYLQLIAVLEDLRWKRGMVGAERGIDTILRGSRLVIPPALVAHLRRTNPSIRKPAFTDLFVVREKWKAYVLGEVAHVENVLPHELKERFHERVDEAEETVSEETANSEVRQTESESTERYELQEAAQNEFRVSAGIDVTSDTTTTGPGVINDTHIGGGADVSYSQAQQRASETSREVITRALSRVQKEVRKARVARTFSRTTMRNRHELNNESENAIAGVYRWLDKVKQVELVRYPNRFVVEFQLPEPGAWTRWAMGRQNRTPALPRDPGVFPPIQPQDITFDDESKLTDYRYLTSQWEARGVQPPPAAIKLGKAIVVDAKADAKWVKPDQSTGELPPGFEYRADENITVPAGWVADSWEAEGIASDITGLEDEKIYAEFRIIVGAVQERSTIIDHTEFELSGSVGGVSEGVVPVSIATNRVLGFAVNLLVTCVPSADTIARWQLETLQAIREGHARIRQRYLDAKAVAETTEGVQIDGMPPARARQLMIQELKRQTIQFLMGTEFYGHGAASKRHPQSGEPSPDFAIAAATAPEIQFLESAFEWSNMNWVFYPYYWAANGDWPQLALLQSADPDFDAFLSSGSARLTVSVRPGLEAQAQLYLDYRILWGGGPMPSPIDTDYLSVAEEIRELQQGARDGEIVDHWDVTLPTTLLLLDTNATFPLENPNVT